MVTLVLLIKLEVYYDKSVKFENCLLPYCFGWQNKLNKLFNTRTKHPFTHGQNERNSDSKPNHVRLYPSHARTVMAMHY